MWWPIFASHILQPVKHTIKSYGCGGPYLLHIFYSQSNISYRVMGVVAHICFTYFMASQTYHTELWVWWSIFASHILQPVKHTIQSYGCGGPYLLHIFYGQSNIPYRVMGVVAHICFTYFMASQTYHTESWVWWPMFASHILWHVKHTIQSLGCGGPYLLHIFYGQSNIPYRVMGVVAHICFTYFMAKHTIKSYGCGGPYLLHIFYFQTYHKELWVWWPIFASHILWPNIPYRVMGVVAHICFTYFTASQTYHTESWVWWPIFASHMLQPIKHTIQSYGCGGPYLLHIFYGQSNIPYRVMGEVAHICFTYVTASQTYHTELWVWWPIFASHILWPVKHTIQSYGCGGPYLLHIFYGQTYHKESWVWWPIFASHMLQPIKHTIQSYGCGGPYLLHICYSQSNIPYRVMGVVAHICFTYFMASQTYHTESWVWWPIFASHILWPVKHTIQSYGCGGPYLLHIFYGQT